MQEFALPSKRAHTLYMDGNANARKKCYTVVMFDETRMEQLGVSFCHYDSVPSTNDLAKERLLSRRSSGEDTDAAGTCGTKDKDYADMRPLVIIADEQTAGRGRHGRSFHSPKGAGIYMSIGFRSAGRLMTLSAAAATCLAIEKVCGVSPGIKWVNDLFLNERKICGILTEGVSDPAAGTLVGTVVGIGVNCYQGSFPPELSGIATSIEEEVSGSQDPSKGSGHSFSRVDLAETIIREFLASAEKTDNEILELYRDRCFILGREIRIRDPYDASDTGTYAQALDIAEDGSLLVKWLSGPKRGETATLSSGEVSVKDCDPSHRCL